MFLEFHDYAVGYAQYVKGRCTSLIKFDARVRQSVGSRLASVSANKSCDMQGSLQRTLEKVG